MRIKKFFEMYEEKYDYRKILRVLKDRFGWGLGVITFIDEFESNDEYFLNPQSEDDYIIQFDRFLKDKRINRIVGKFNNTHPILLGKWKMDYEVTRPESIYNKLY